MKKKILFVFAFIMTCAGIARFWEPATGTFYTACVNAYCLHHFGNALQSGPIYKDRDYWAFENPEIHHKGAKLSAGRLLLNVSFKPMSRTMDVKLIVEDSHIDFREEIAHLQKVIQQIVSKTLPYWLFKVHLNFRIERGKVSWKETLAQKSISHEADFRFSAISESLRSEISFALFLDGRNLHSNSFALQISKEGNNPLDADLKFCSVDCCKMGRIYEAFHNSFDEWKIRRGVIDGSMHFHQPEMQPAHLQGRMILEEFICENTPLEIKASLPNAIIDLETTLNGKKPPLVSGKIHFDKGVFVEQGKEIPSCLGLKNLVGGISFLPNERMKIDFIGEELFSTYTPLDLTLEVGDVSGNIAADMAFETLLEGMDASLLFQGGSLKFLGINNHLWHLDQVETELTLKKGALQKSEMKGVFEGLNGNLLVDWMSPKEFLKVDFSGPARNLSAFAPDSFMKEIEKAFFSEQMTVTGGMFWCDTGSYFVGQLGLSRANTQTLDTINFGFDIEKSSQKLWSKWPADEFAVSYWENAGYEAMQKVMPPIMAPLILLESNWIKQEAGIAGLVVRNGWFQAEKLPLEIYATPFIFPYDEAIIKGTGVFEGVFDHKSLSIAYEAEDVLLENRFMALSVDKMHSKKNAANVQKATHYFDFDKKIHYGTLPLSKASYLEKSSGLLFTDIDSLVIFEGNNVHFSELTTSLDGMVLKGSLDIDFGLPNDGYFALDAKIHALKGTVVQLKSIFTKLKGEYAFLDFPVQGDLALSQEGASISFAAKPEGIEFDLSAKGALSNAYADLQNLGVAIEKGKLNFSYDHKKKSFLLSNIFGNVFLNSAQLQNDQLDPRTNKYVIAGDYIHFVDYSQQSALFDVWLGDQNRDIIRLVGKTAAEESSDGSHRTQVYIDRELSHFGDARPSNFQLVVKDWKAIERFGLGLDINLNTFFHDLHRLGIGSLFSSQKALEKAISEVNAISGNIKLNMLYQQEPDEFSYQIDGACITLNDYTFDNCLISGRKALNYWLIDTMKCDDFSLLASVTNNEDLWDFDRLKLQYRDKFLIEMIGKYHRDERKASMHIGKLEMNLEALKVCGPFMKSFAEKCSPRGKMRATGDLEADFSKKIPSWKVDALLDAAFESWEMNGLCFQDVQNVSCHFVSDKGVTFRNLNGQVVTPDGRLSRAHLSAEKVICEFPTGEVAIDSLEFQVPAHHLPWFASHITDCFPTLFTKESADVMRNCKLQGVLEGTLQYDYTPPYTAMQLKLKEGNYIFLNAEHQLKDFVLEYDPFEFKVVSKYLFGDEFVSLQARSTSPNLAHGELILTDRHLEGHDASSADHALFIIWENDEINGFSIKHARGDLHGLNFQMKRDPMEPLSSEMMHLIGEVAVNLEKARVFFPKEMLEKVVDWKIGDGYKLKGNWKFQKEGPQDYTDKVHFTGTFEGDNFSLKGCRFDKLLSHLEYTPKKVRFRDFSITDAAGVLSVDRIDFMKGADSHWYFSMPEMKIHQFKPSLLREENMPRLEAEKPFALRELVMHTCQGKLNEPNSWIGKGILHFTNRSKKRSQNIIFQIPADILSRIGLDLSVMTPIIGSIEYKVENGRIHLAKFKNIYSEGKLSKFYLAPSFDSTLDFDGNLHLRVKMKQYNLLFKLAELGTVHIGGSLQNPVWNFE